MFAPELRAVIRRWPVQSNAVRRSLIAKCVCPDCGSDEPPGSWHNGTYGGDLPMRCYRCGFVETDTPRVRAYEKAVLPKPQRSK